jgi:hypothetical protein
MKTPYMHIRRIPYEEPHHIQLEFRASNGMFAGVVDIYCNVDDLKEMAKSLKSFPARSPDEYIYEYGSLEPAKRTYRYFKLRFYTTDHTGHCAVQFSVNLKDEAPDEGVCVFSFRVELSAIHRLGQLLDNFHKLQHLELQWSPAGGALFDDYQNEVG